MHQHKCKFCGGIRPHRSGICLGCGTPVAMCSGRLKKQERYSIDAIVNKDVPPAPTEQPSLVFQLAEDVLEREDEGSQAVRKEKHSRGRRY